MRGIQHVTLTVILANLLGVYLLKPSTFIDVMLFSLGMLFVAFGSIAPDIDIKQSMIRKWYVMMPMLPFWIAQLGVYWVLGTIYGFKHRGVMHSLIGWSASFAVVAVVADVMYGRTISMVVCGGFAVGYLAHLIEDELATKTRIDWIPAPRFMKSWKFGIVAIVVLVLLTVPATAAGVAVLNTKSCDEVIKSFDILAYQIFWFGVKVMLIFGGIMAYAGMQHKSVNIVKGIILSFAMVFVFEGILLTIFT